MPEMNMLVDLSFKPSFVKNFLEIKLACEAQSNNAFDACLLLVMNLDDGRREYSMPVVRHARRIYD